MRRLFPLVCVAIALFAMASAAQRPLVNTKFRRLPADKIEPLPPVPPNIVLIVLDDIGVDKIAEYGEGPPGAVPPCTPNFDAFARSGMMFRRAYANPVCSPTRATILTGRYSYRTGLGLAIVPTSPTIGLSVRYETLLPEILTDYETAAVGKWHLTGVDDTVFPGAGLQHPLNSGFGFYAGSMYNLNDDPVACGASCVPPACVGPFDYSNWVKTAAGVGGMLEQSCTTSYATTDTTDDAIDRIQSMEGPWFLYIGYNAAHVPIHDPPAGLCHPAGTCLNQNCPSDPTGSLPERYNAAVEALDVEFGRLIAAIDQADPRAYVIVVGDNGTAVGASEGVPGGCFDPDRSKGTFYEGGVRVPLIIRGPTVPVDANDYLVNTTDLYATVADLAGVPSSAEDSVSLAPYFAGTTSTIRRFVYSEGFFPNQETPDHPSTTAFGPAAHIRAMRDGRYKLIRFTDITGFEDEELYDLWTDPCESIDLCPGVAPCDILTLSPDAAAAYTRLQAQMVMRGVY